MKKYIPNTLTSLNLVFGMCAIMFVMQAEKDFTAAVVCIFLALVADVLDGRVARALHVTSAIGKELDSLCDCVSFGAAPALIVYMYVLKDMGIVGAVGAIIFAVCGALRLARFNVNTDVVKGYFMGMPIPAAGCAVVALVLSGVSLPLWYIWLYVVAFGLLMVSTVKYPDFKGGGENLFFILPLVVSFVVGTLLYIKLFSSAVWLTMIPLALFFINALYGVTNLLYKKMK